MVSSFTLTLSDSVVEGKAVSEPKKRPDMALFMQGDFGAVLLKGIELGVLWDMYITDF